MKQKLFDAGDPGDFSQLFWRVFMTYLGSDDCAKLTINERVLVVEMYNYFEKWLHKRCKESDEEMEELRRQAALKEKLNVV